MGPANKGGALTLVGSGVGRKEAGHKRGARMSQGTLGIRLWMNEETRRSQGKARLQCALSEYRLPAESFSPHQGRGGENEQTSGHFL